MAQQPEDPTAYVRALERMTLDDDTPGIEGPNASIGYIANSNYNYADREAYNTSFTQEAATMAQIVRDCLVFLWPCDCCLSHCRRRVCV